MMVVTEPVNGRGVGRCASGRTAWPEGEGAGQEVEGGRKHASQRQRRRGEGGGWSRRGVGTHTDGDGAQMKEKSFVGRV